MILMVFNDYFPNTNGFGTRCMREVKALSDIDDVVIVCRKRDNELAEEDLNFTNRKVGIVRFWSAPEVNEQPQVWGFAGFFELYRNVWLMASLKLSLFKVFWRYRNQSVRLYAVSSPLFLAYIAGIMSKPFNNIKAFLVGIHDLEPEMAFHIKGLHVNHWFMKLEYWLERVVCGMYVKTVVTSNMQKARIVERVGIPAERAFVVPNAEPHHKLIEKKSSSDVRKKLGLQEDDWVLGYTSSLTYRYTYEGLLDLIKLIPEIQRSIRNLKLLVIGGGHSLEKVQQISEELGVGDVVIFTGMVPDVYPYLSLCQLGIVPWKEDIMTQTQLPTKLFAYMQSQLPILAPDFGEFRRLIKHGDTGYLYSSKKTLIENLRHMYNSPKQVRKVVEKSSETYQSHYSEEVTINNFKKIWTK